MAGFKARSLEQLGNITYNNIANAKYYLRNTNFLELLITALTKSPSRADAFPG